MEYKSNNNVVYSCKYHVVFCPKYRRSVLINGVDVRLKELIQQTCEQLNVEIIEIGLSTLFQTNFFRLFFRYCTGV